MQTLDTETLHKMIRVVKMTRIDEIDCDGCFARMSKFAELELEGKSPSDALPLVQDHLNKCDDCKEEYEALLAALKAI